MFEDKTNEFDWVPFRVYNTSAQRRKEIAKQKKEQEMNSFRTKIKYLIVTIYGVGGYLWYQILFGA